MALEFELKWVVGGHMSAQSSSRRIGFTAVGKGTMIGVVDVGLVSFQAFQ